MKRSHMIVLLALVLSAFLLAYGCETKKHPSGKLAAKINNYELTTDDFKEKANLAMLDKYPPGDMDKAKADLLEELIIKNILIQEAQAQDFDKDRAFMKEIEGYWEQALLKLLIKKKIEEFSSKVTVSGGEAKDAKVRQMLENWVKELRNRANVKIYKENLQTIQAK